MKNLPTVAQPQCQSVTCSTHQSVNICLGCHCHRLNCHLAIVFVCRGLPLGHVSSDWYKCRTRTKMNTPPPPPPTVFLTKPTNCGQMSGGSGLGWWSATIVAFSISLCAVRGWQPHLSSRLMTNTRAPGHSYGFSIERGPWHVCVLITIKSMSVGFPAPNSLPPFSSSFASLVFLKPKRQRIRHFVSASLSLN